MTTTENMRKLTGEFSRDNFIQAIGGYNTLDDLLRAHKKDVADTNLLTRIGNEIGEPVRGEPAPDLYVRSDPQVTRNTLNRHAGRYTNRLVDYTGSNLATILDGLDAESQFKLLSKIPLRKTGNSLVDSVVDLVEEARVMAAYMQQGQEVQYILNQFKKLEQEIGDNAEMKDELQWRMSLFLENMSLDPQGYGSTVFGSYVNTNDKRLKEALSENGQLSKKKTTPVIKGVADKLKGDHDSEADENKKKEKWADLATAYVTIAKEFYDKNKPQESGEQQQQAA